MASAQIKPFAQNTEANIEAHIRMIELAAIHGVKLISFPEMSLTGYELERAAELAIQINDDRLVVFKELATSYQMMIVVGAPVKIERELYIGSFVFTPDGTTHVYTKQYLHVGEEKFFSPGFDFDPIPEWGGERISFAICADITNPLHPKAASEKGTTLYLPGIFYSTPTGIVEAYEQLGDYAGRYKMKILMANYTGYLYGMESRGKSAYWDETGKLLGNMNTHEEGLLIITTDAQESISHKIITSGNR